MVPSHQNEELDAITEVCCHGLIIICTYADAVACNQQQCIVPIQQIGGDDSWTVEHFQSLFCMLLFLLVPRLSLAPEVEFSLSVATCIHWSERVTPGVLTIRARICPKRRLMLMSADCRNNKEERYDKLNESEKYYIQLSQ